MGKVFSIFLLVCFISLIGRTETVFTRTTRLFGQAFRDGFWRALSGKLAVVTYMPVRKGNLVYYYQVPHYYSKHGGYSVYAHAHPYSAGGYNHNSIGYPRQKGHGISTGAYSGQYGYPAHYQY